MVGGLGRKRKRESNNKKEKKKKPQGLRLRCEQREQKKRERERRHELPHMKRAPSLLSPLCIHLTIQFSLFLSLSLSISLSFSISIFFNFFLFPSLSPISLYFLFCFFDTALVGDEQKRIHAKELRNAPVLHAFSHEVFCIRHPRPGLKRSLSHAFSHFLLFFSFLLPHCFISLSFFVSLTLSLSISIWRTSLLVK